MMKRLLLICLFLLVGLASLGTVAAQNGTTYYDPRLDALGVTIAPADVRAGEEYWQIVRVEWQDEQEARGRHNIDVEMLNADGSRALGEQARVSWADGGATLMIEDKPIPEYGANFPMYKAGCAYSLEALGLPSDQINCLGLGDIERRDWTIHVVYRVTFQRVAKGGGGTPQATATPYTGIQWPTNEIRTFPNCGLTRVLGRVVNSDQQGLAGIRVALTWNDPTAAVFRTTTNSLGEWEIFLNDHPVQAPDPGWLITFWVDETQVSNVTAQTDSFCGDGARNVIEFITQSPEVVEPTPTPTPEPQTFAEWLAQSNDAIQEIELNPDAALQKAAAELALVPTSEEEWSQFCGLDGCSTIAHQRYESLQTGDVFDCWVPVPDWINARCDAR